MKGVQSLNSRFLGLFWALVASNALSLALFLARYIDAGNNRYWFLVWNLFLAWLPLVFAWLLVKRLGASAWLSLQSMALTFLWLAFLPNSFYMITDFIHLHATGEVGLLYDIVMLSSFIFNSLVVGFMSLYMVHRELLLRIRRRDAHMIVAGILFVCSFAIYLGRYLRWNTWDVLVKPAGILFDVSDYIINPAAKPQVFVTTLTFFALLGTMYAVAWQLVRAVSANSRH